MGGWIVILFSKGASTRGISRSRPNAALKWAGAVIRLQFCPTLWTPAQLTPSIAQMITTNGRQDGRSTRSNGAAISMAGVAPPTEKAMRLNRPPATTAILDSPIGSRGGLFLKRLGA